MSNFKTRLLDRRGFLKTTGAATVAASLPMAARASGGHLRVGKAHGQTTDTLEPRHMGKRLYARPRFCDTRSPHLGWPRTVNYIRNWRESWEASEDASEWRFRIRKGVSFHSGKELSG